jgi:hypothetical protein
MESLRLQADLLLPCCALTDGEDASAAKGRIKHLTKLFKQHRSALNANYKFIATA